MEQVTCILVCICWGVYMSKCYLEYVSIYVHVDGLVHTCHGGCPNQTVLQHKWVEVGGGLLQQGLVRTVRAIHYLCGAYL